MIRIIRYFLISISWFFFYSKIRKSDFRNILSNYNLQLRALSLWEVFRFLNDLITDNLNERSWLNTITLPFNVSFRVLFDNNYKKLFLFGYGFMIIIYRWFQIMKKLLLLPFKLGIFSFLYSILGIDITWFLNLFNIFPINIPYWVYFQYLTLYSNWLQWWYNTVDVKSISSVPLKEVKKIKNKISVEKDHVELNVPDNNNKLKYIVGGLLIIGGICFALWYFDLFSSDKPSTGSNPTQR